MTSAAAPVNITFGGTDYTILSGIFLYRCLRGGPGTLPEVAGRDDEIPRAEGIFVRNRVGRTRTIELWGFVRGVSTTEATDRDAYWANRAALQTAFNPRSTASLVIDTGAVSYTITARPLNVDYNEVLPSFAEVSIVLQSTGPDWA